MKGNYIRFDWAIKRLLRQKANFGILEGFLSELLGEDIKIQSLLESEANQQDEYDKYNRVDLMAENSKQELIIVEIQNTREAYYFHRMLYGASKAICDYIQLGEHYNKVRKVYSINIVYFDFGQGSDYIYHGTTDFIGIHTHDTLLLSKNQQKTFAKVEAGKLFPEYYVLRVDEFNQKAITPLDEWISYLKTGEIPEHTKARGLDKALEILKMDRMTPSERTLYIRHMENLAIQWDQYTTAEKEGMEKGMEQGLKQGIEQGIEQGIKQGIKQGIEKGIEKGIEQGIEKGIKIEKQATARQLKSMQISTDNIQKITGLSIEEIESLD